MVESVSLFLSLDVSDERSQSKIGLARLRVYSNASRQREVESHLIDLIFIDEQLTNCILNFREPLLSLSLLFSSSSKRSIGIGMYPGKERNVSWHWVTIQLCRQAGKKRRESFLSRQQVAGRSDYRVEVSSGPLNRSPSNYIPIYSRLMMLI